MFVSNTNFNNEVAYVYVYTDQTFDQLKQDLDPVLQNLNSFERLAIRKGYDLKLKVTSTVNLLDLKVLMI